MSTEHPPPAGPEPGAHATGPQAWAILLGFLAFTVGGIVVYLSNVWSAV